MHVIAHRDTLPSSSTGKIADKERAQAPRKPMHATQAYAREYAPSALGARDWFRGDAIRGGQLCGVRRRERGESRALRKRLSFCAPFHGRSYYNTLL